MSPQETQVYVLDAGAGRELSDALQRHGYRFGTAPHAHFQARGEGVTVTWYRSGKLVVQGAGLDSWARRYARGSRAAASKSARAADTAQLPDIAIGADEAGKGDSFGPLVVCAVAVPSQAAAGKLRKAGVTDSKQLSDARIRVLAPWIREHFAHEEECLLPALYNSRYLESGSNLNTLLAAIHVRVAGELQRRSGVSDIVIDRFSSRSPVSKRLAGAKSGVRVHEVPRAERCPAVAAASVLARAGFLDSLERLSDDYAVDLPRGSGAPVRPALRRFLDIHGPDKLGQVAKLHFKNVQAALERR